MSWNKKVHVTSTLERKKGQFSLFIGRWQPLHAGHKEMFQQVLDEGGNVLICIRENIDVNLNNPFTTSEVMNNIMEEYKDLISKGKVRVMIIPDICSVEFGRGVGYDIIERIPPVEIAEISATKIRQEMFHNSIK
jgi:nicotinamide mononucleotide adenylyltransferase